MRAAGIHSLIMTSQHQFLHCPAAAHGRQCRTVPARTVRTVGCCGRLQFIAGLHRLNEALPAAGIDLVPVGRRADDPVERPCAPALENDCVRAAGALWRLNFESGHPCRDIPLARMTGSGPGAGTDERRLAGTLITTESIRRTNFGADVRQSQQLVHVLEAAQWRAQSPTCRWHSRASREGLSFLGSWRRGIRQVVADSASR
jgi:hypothetical protein